MFSLLGKTMHSKAVILLHVGSASVSAGIADLSGQKPSLIFTAREPLPYREKLDFAHLLKATEARIQSLIERVIHEGAPRYKKSIGHAPDIQSIVVVLASPWYVTRTSVLQYTKENSVVVTEDLVHGMMNTVRDAFEKEVETGKYEHIGAEAVLLEESLISVELNGYVFNEPFGRKAKDVRISVLYSLISKELQTTFSRVFEKVLHRMNVSWNSFTLVVFSLIRDLYPEEKTFLIMDIDGEVTDVSLVKNEVLLESVSFPCGKYSVLRCLGEDAGPAEARISVLAGHTMDDPGVEKAREEWLRQYTQALEELREHNAIPHRLFLSGHEDVLPWFEKVLLTYEGSSGVFTKPQAIVLLKRQFLEPFVVFREDAAYDTNLVALLLYIAKHRAALHL